MRFLVVGANGFVGKPLCKELVNQERICRVVVRSENSQIENVEVAEIGSIDGNSNWADALLEVNVVIHLAARVHMMHDDAANPLEEFRKVNVLGTEHLARVAATSGVRRLVYVSSIKVNGEETSDGQFYSEQDIPAPQDPYAISKWEAELALHRVAKESGLEIVIIRPPLVYGAEARGNFAHLLKILKNGIPLPLGSVSNLRDLIYVENMVDALITCATHPAAAGQTYLVSDGESISTPDLIRQLAKAMEVPARIFPFPLSLLKLTGKIFGKSAEIDRLLGSLRINSGKIRRELNWKPPYTLQQGLQATALTYQSHKAI